jgi:hypothetical protein
LSWRFEGVRGGREERKEGRRRGCRGLCLSWGDEEIAEEQAFTAHFLEFKEPLLGSRSGQSTKQDILKKSEEIERR